MPIDDSVTIDEMPVVPLACWSIRQTETGSRHFVGYNMLHCNGRVSTAITSFDADTRTAVTASGRRYRLEGRAGADKDAEYVWGIAVRAWRIESWTDVTHELVPDWRSPQPRAERGDRE
ncbi:hypothetical protein [Paraburkholderia sp. 22B1P]|uniref:hypothetical protein n=1 Tax=Paraburkholderia sp. 22B1P TaxID=3080498 RepID=UPI00309045A9|nr:hypothetical protein PBP221_57150 [Paraburkholderia sp. 22B1P]